ncbi:MAG: hypothetical protein KHX03_03210 [Clostridium sp.]|nr:hypothetical protein [Clostridium sp.]
MNISPLSFKGLITIQTKESKNSPTVTHTYKTTKKQDGMLLKAATDTLQTIGYKEHVYGSDTYKFHKKLEEIIGRRIEQPSMGDGKFLAIGGDNNNLFNTQKYDSSYNKIFYSDISMQNKPKSTITIDLMEPEERLKGAMESFSKIEDRIYKMFHSIKKDDRFNFLTRGIPKEKYGKMEEILNKTLYYLDGNINGPDFSDKAQNLHNSYHAYETLMKNLLPAAGKKYSLQEFDEFRYPILEEKDYNKVKRAIYYLQSALPELQKD